MWLRQDLRVEDQPAFHAATAEGAVIPVYVLDDEAPGRWRMGAAQRWWLHHSLSALRRDLEARGSRLILRRGGVTAELARIASDVGATRVHATAHYEPWWRAAEKEVAAALDLALHPGDVLASPSQVMTRAGTPYRIYTPCWRALQDHLPPETPLPAPQHLAGPAAWPESDDLASWRLLPAEHDWAAAFGAEWSPGEASARAGLEQFAEEVEHYADARDQPGEEGTSRLSPHLHFGEVSPRSVWHRLGSAGADKFRKELAWRDFSRNVILDQPWLGARAGRPAFASFPWRTGEAAEPDFAAWKKGLTGYPLVDAGMRQLWATGWMHNRVRMVAASFLVKHLLLDWRRGAEWFWDTLVDADYANNSQNWQWVAGTGVDSQPFYRIMAPTAQSRKFGAAKYIRRWVPELAGLDDEAVHEPTREVGDYPLPIIPHRAARERALSALRAFGASDLA